MQVLIVDDNAAVREALKLLLAMDGIGSIGAASVDEAMAAIGSRDIGVVIQDMNFRAASTSGEEGMRLFRTIRARRPDLPILLITAWADLESAVLLMREGAEDYLAKPWDDAKLLDKVRRLLPARGAGNGTPASLGGLVYASSVMEHVVSLALRAAASDAPVLITGPSGTGKERIAELIRINSQRRDRPFIVVNAGALPKDLVEAELFGAEAGAYTGATTLRPGRVESASTGTLFLDEITDLSANGQSALLRVLQTGEYQRLGSSTALHADVRWVAATNADLSAAIARGAFRADLYYRLAVIEIRIPPLAERPEDIEPLAEHFLAANGIAKEALDAEARRALLEYAWPGNVRELENRVQRAVLLGSGRRIGASDLFGPVQGLPATGEAERAEVESALRDAAGVVSRAARSLAITRQALYRKMMRLGISVERRVKP